MFRTVIGLILAAACLIGLGLESASAIGPTPGGFAEQMVEFDYDGTIVTLQANPEIVQSWLPEGLTIANDTPFSLHPVILVLGTQSSLTHHGIVTIRPSFARCYQESFIVVPYLKWDGSDSDEYFSYYVRIYLNNQKGATLGRKLYGWNKHCVSIDATESSYTIMNPDGNQPMLQLQVASSEGVTQGATQPVDQTNRTFQAVRDMLDQTLLLNYKGQLFKRRLDYGMDCASLESPSRVEMMVTEQFMPGLQLNQFEFQGINNEPFGAFRYRGQVVAEMLK